MTLVQSFTVGSLRCHLLEGGRQQLDGGAMFGVVAKPLWERKIPPDDRNRIPLGLRCLLVEHEAGPVLVDTAIGNKENEKFRRIYGVENAGTRGPTQLEDALHEAGFEPTDICFVINTHLHFDHAGGNTYVEGGSVEGSADLPPRLSFPNATYIVQRGELEFARRTNERTAASYLARNFEPIAKAGRWQLVDGESRVLPGIRVMPTPGHVPYHQAVLIEEGGETAAFVADLIPTTAHLPLPWIMGYDLEPLVTLESKRRLINRAADDGWLICFEHDPQHGIGRVLRDGKSFIYQGLDTP